MRRAWINRIEAPLWVLATALGYFLLAIVSLYATKGENSIAAIWPPSGYFLAMLLLMPSRARAPAFVLMAVASTAANWLGGVSLAEALAFTLANATEASIAFTLIQRREPGQLSFMVPRSVGNFCLSAVIATLTGAGMATLLVGASASFFLSWFTTVGLGIFIVTPPIVMLGRLFRSGVMANLSLSMKLESAGILTSVAMISLATFSQSQFPLLFLPFVAVVGATYRLGPFGAATSILIVSVIGSLLTGHSIGLSLMIEGGQQTVILFLQFYLVTMLFSALPLAAMLVIQQRLTKGLAQSNRWLLQAEAAALVGHWRVDLIRWEIYWSDQSYRIHGLSPGEPMSVKQSLDYYVLADRERISATLREAHRTGEPFTFTGQIIRADGQVRHVKSHGSIEKNRRGKSIAIFGSIQDVTQTVEDAQNLHAARITAEKAANTDMLTGLPNRRHTLTVLAEAMDIARLSSAPLALAIFDIDHFKQVNDSYGHAVGDDVIRRVANRAKASLGDGDMVGRFGGEEFVCVLRGESAKAATEAAENVRKAIETQHMGADGLPKVTVSVGLAHFDGETAIEELLHRADKALYLAKHDGRNRLRQAA